MVYNKSKKSGFSGVVHVDMRLPKSEVFKIIYEAKVNKNIAVATHVDECDYVKKFDDNYDYVVSIDGRYVINLYNNYIKLATTHQDGYRSFHMYDQRTKTMVKHYAHVCVANAYIPKVDGKPEVDHIDRDRSNNDVSNLRWADRIDQLGNRG